MVRDDIVPSASNFSLEFARVFGCTMGCYSQCATTLLAATRFLKIIIPFIKIQKRWIVAYFFIYTTFMTANNIPTLLIRHIDESFTPLFNLLCDICLWVNVVHCLLGVVFSLGTVVYLYTRSPGEGEETGSGLHSRRAGVTILLMNIPYVTSVALIVLVHVSPWQLNIHDIVYGFVPIVTSTLNPLILISRNASTRSSIRLIKLSRICKSGFASKASKAGISSTHWHM
eukprot:sb/3469567/